MNTGTETNWVDEVISYIKERIESPFVPSFIASWSLFNSDFILYIIFGDSSKKYEVLAKWDFSDFLFGLNYPYFEFYLECAKSFIHPLLLAIALSIGYSSFSFLLSGLRYKISAFMRSFAVKHKSNFDKVEERIALETDIGKLGAERSSIGGAIAIAQAQMVLLNQEKLKLEQFVESSKKIVNSTKHLIFFNFLTTSMQMFDKYSKNPDSYNLKERKIISENSLLSFDIVGQDTEVNYHDLPISELFLIPELFAPEDDALFNILFTAIIESKIGRYRIRDEKEFEIRKITNFEPKESA